MLNRHGYELEFEDTFDGDALDERRWLPHYLPQWSSPRALGRAVRLGDGPLRLLIEADQPPWCPEFDGEIRVSSLQTGVFAGPVGSTIGQTPLQPGAGRARGAGERPALHAAVRPVRAARQGDRRPALHGRALDDRLRGRARAVGGDLHLRDLRARRAARTRPASAWACARSATRGSRRVRGRAGRRSTPASSTSTRPSGRPSASRSSSTTSWSRRSSSRRLPDAVHARHLRVPRRTTAGRAGRDEPTRRSSWSTLPWLAPD